MKALLTTLTERGQVSMPRILRRQLGLKPGQSLAWEKISDEECRVRIVRPREKAAIRSMRGFMKGFQTGTGLPETSAGWMRLLREGE